jgi:hypothetical protein
MSTFNLWDCKRTISVCRYAGTCWLKDVSNKICRYQEKFFWDLTPCNLWARERSSGDSCFFRNAGKCLKKKHPMASPRIRIYCYTQCLCASRLVIHRNVYNRSSHNFSQTQLQLSLGNRCQTELKKKHNRSKPVQWLRSVLWTGTNRVDVFSRLNWRKKGQFSKYCLLLRIKDNTHNPRNPVIRSRMTVNFISVGRNRGRF